MVPDGESDADIAGNGIRQQTTKRTLKRIVCPCLPDSTLFAFIQSKNGLTSTTARAWRPSMLGIVERPHYLTLWHSFSSLAWPRRCGSRKNLICSSGFARNGVWYGRCHVMVADSVGANPGHRRSIRTKSRPGARPGEVSILTGCEELAIGGVSMCMRWLFSLTGACSILIERLPCAGVAPSRCIEVGWDWRPSAASSLPTSDNEEAINMKVNARISMHLVPLQPRSATASITRSAAFVPVLIQSCTRTAARSASSRLSRRVPGHRLTSWNDRTSAPDR